MDATSAAEATLAMPALSTLLGLVQALSRLGVPDREIEGTARALVGSGRVVLTGNFAGQRLD
jgi:hypothetical protein